MIILGDISVFSRRHGIPCDVMIYRYVKILKFDLIDPFTYMVRKPKAAIYFYFVISYSTLEFSIFISYFLFKNGNFQIFSRPCGICKVPGYARASMNEKFKTSLKESGITDSTISTLIVQDILSKDILYSLNDEEFKLLQGQLTVGQVCLLTKTKLMD